MLGRTVAHYQITDKLGEGGMGEVYRATDTKLNRDVALKVLPDAVARDPQRLGRFAREAQMLAALNHPHIGAVYGLEQEGDTHALVMELVEGETLQDRIARGPVPLAEAARIGLELARAIEYAHDKGIVHRDLKPANVMLDAEGQVKVLDFGLAKAMEERQAPEDLANSPTLSIAATQAGLILGTAAYMSPEQASGTGVDRRADIWSYGVVMAEVLSGRRQFGGETVSHTLAAVLKDQPDWDRLEAQVPHRIVELLRRCLDKDPKLRLQAIGEARVLWESYLSDPAAFETPRPGPGPRGGSGSRLPWAIAALSVVAVAVLAYLQLTRSPSSGPEPTRRLTIPVRGVAMFFELETAPAMVSPDGRYVVYGSTDDDGDNRLRLRRLDSFDTLALDGTEGATYPFWSPDSRFVGYFQSGQLRSREIATGRTQTLGGERAFIPRGATWMPDGSILFVPNSNTGIWILEPSGESRQLTTPDPGVADSSHRWPYALPDGSHFLYLMWTNDATALAEHGGVYLASIDGSTPPRRVLPETTSAVYTPSGYLLAAQESNLMAVPFDAARREVTGDASIVAEGVLVNRNNGFAAFSASHEGTLVFARGSGRIPPAEISWVDRGGGVTATDLEPAPIFRDLRLSPDATRAATTLPGGTGDPEVWILDLIRGVRTRLTPPAPWTYESPLWSPDGSRVLYVSARLGTWDLFARNADGSGQEEPVLLTDYDKESLDWHDDRILYWRDQAEAIGSMIALHHLETGESTPLFEELNARTRPRFSPDGEFVVFDGTEGDRRQVFVYRIDSGARWQVSSNGGIHPRWSDDGREIVYLGPQRRMMRVDVTVDGPQVVLGRPQEMFQFQLNVAAWDVTGDHQRFLVATRPEVAYQPLHVVLGWDRP